MEMKMVMKVEMEMEMEDVPASLEPALQAAQL